MSRVLIPNACANRGRMGVQLKTAPGTRCGNNESDSQGLANRLEGTVN